MTKFNVGDAIVYYSTIEKMLYTGIIIKVKIEPTDYDNVQVYWSRRGVKYSIAKYTFNELSNDLKKKEYKYIPMSS